MAITVFFSWQSDRPSINGKNFIERALEKAIDRILGSKTLYNLEISEATRDLAELPVDLDLELDKDTKDEPGSPPIFDTIREKIDRAAILVSDLTSIGQRGNGELIPNPNVLVEYGYAYKTMTYKRVIQVMNVAYGAPTRSSMPFDLSLHRSPITYNLPEDATDEHRKEAKTELAKNLERAMRRVLAMPVVQENAEYREPLDGRARFRPPNTRLGLTQAPFGPITGESDSEAFLLDGPAMWLRVGPIKPKLPPFKVAEMKDLVLQLASLPLNEHRLSSAFVRSGDGCGFCSNLNDNGPFGSVAFMFTDGEIWVINPWRLSRYPALLVLDETIFCATLKTASVLLDKIGIKGPYRWVAGFEGAAGRKLVLDSDPYHRYLGQCATEIIEKNGTFDLQQEPDQVLEPLFADLFDHCGVSRPAK